MSYEKQGQHALSRTTPLLWLCILLLWLATEVVGAEVSLPSVYANSAKEAHDTVKFSTQSTNIQQSDPPVMDQDRPYQVYLPMITATAWQGQVIAANSTLSISNPAIAYTLYLPAIVRSTADRLIVITDTESTEPLDDIDINQGVLLEKQITSGDDDAEEKISGSMSLSSSDLELVVDGSNNQTVGLRFVDLTIPKGAEITQAYIQFGVDESSAVTTTLTIQGQAADNAAAFTSAKHNLSNRVRTANSTDWSPPAWNTEGEMEVNQRTPNLAAVLQEIINRPGWTSGNALAFLITGNGSRIAYAYESQPARPARLYIAYTTGSGQTNQPPVVKAGSDQTLSLPASAQLAGVATDDGLPNGSLTVAWSKVSGPGTVTWDTSTAQATTATFSAAGSYVLRLTATDGTLTATDEVTVSVNNPSTTNQPPVVKAGSDQTLSLPASAQLAGVATDDGLPNGSLTVAWSKVSGPGTVTWDTSTAQATTATFSAAGSYVLRLTATDGTLTATDEVKITVNARAAACVAPAFPGAEGFGAFAVGGRGGRVIEVTNLNSAGPGSLREALLASGPRTVVFRVGGTIELDESITIKTPYLTVAGQTAPGGGITLKGKGLEKDLLKVQTHDVIIRYVRVRSGPGGDSGAIAIGNEGAHDIILDHCSVSWGVDENLSTWYDSYNITIQWCVIAEGLNNSTHSEGEHSKGFMLGSEGSHSFSVHHNLLAHNDERNPRIKAEGVVDFTNNVIYNYGVSAGWITNDYGELAVNYIGNYFKPGPDSNQAKYELKIDKESSSAVAVFVQGNISPHRLDENQPQENMVTPESQAFLVQQQHPSAFIATTSAQEAYTQVLANAGATLPIRDAVDQRIIQDVIDGTGSMIDDPAQVGGWPELASGKAPVDTDQDGMPDTWEQQYGFNRNDPADGISDTDTDGYTNLEEYLNGTHPFEQDLSLLHQCTH